MGISEYVLSYLVLMMVSEGVLCVLECSQCVSDSAGDCANNPPPAKPCNSYQDKNRPVNCMVAKKKTQQVFWCNLYVAVPECG